MAEPKQPVEFCVRVLSAPGRDVAVDPVILAGFSALDHTATVGPAVTGSILAHRPKDEIDLDGRVEITRKRDGSLFSETLSPVETYLTQIQAKPYTRSSRM